MPLTHRDILLTSHDGPVPHHEMDAAIDRDRRGVPVVEPIHFDRVSDRGLQDMRGNALRFSRGLYRQAKGMVREANLAGARAASVNNPTFWRDQRKHYRLQARQYLELRRAYRDEVVMIDMELRRRGHMPMAAE